MTLNNSEANAVNVLVRALVEAPDECTGEPYTVEQLQQAVDTLVGAAHKRLWAGLRPGQVVITSPSTVRHVEARAGDWRYAVPCEECGAAIDQRCLTNLGVARTTRHSARVQAAMRARRAS